MKARNHMSNEQLRKAINETIQSLQPRYNGFGGKIDEVKNEEREMLLAHLGELLAAEKIRARGSRLIELGYKLPKHSVKAEINRLK